jgi:sensor histidine kinase YesM
VLRRRSAEEEKMKRNLAEFELKAIQAQMNPHFIFNCLSSIKYYVLSGQKENAEKFLDHFSFLIRKFLESSEHVETMVREEANLLNEYLELEKMRMGGNMEYSIRLQKEAEGLSIPTMLTQPYVENSIKHGIAHMEKGGMLTISYTLESGELVIVVEDNGIGREKAYDIQQAKVRHKPKGIGLVEEKSYLMRKLFALDISVKITDKYDDYGNATGTKVEIRIPQKKIQ